MTPASRGGAALLLTLACVPLAALTGFTQRSLFGTPIEPYAYGFFLDRYPLFTCGIVYGAARIGLAAFQPEARSGLGLLGAPLGLALFLTACLHPTFGGLIIRAGYMAGSMAFTRNLPLPAAFGLGAAASALAYGLALGLGSALAGWRLAIGWRPLGRALLSLAALWWAALVLGAPRTLGIDVTGGWPGTPLSASAAATAAAVIVLALLPHALHAHDDGPAKPHDRQTRSERLGVAPP